MRLVHAALQRLGAKLLPAADGRRPASQEASDRGLGPQDSGTLVGDAARPAAVARPADCSERPVAAVEAAAPRGVAATPAGETASGAGDAGVERHAMKHGRNDASARNAVDR